MESKLKELLGVSSIKLVRKLAGGCISEGNVFETENGLLFVKTNSDEKARLMFEGEIQGLKAIESTHTVKVPKPISVLDVNVSGLTALVMEFVEMKSLSGYAEKLGEQLARMHLFNINSKDSQESVHKLTDSDEAHAHVNQFGFHVPTCCGYIPQNNEWKSDWIEFYAQQRLDHQIKLVEKTYGERESIELWSQLHLKISSLFKDVTVIPSLLHGDLWSGNAAETHEGPVIFDPAVFYGHSEFDLAIADMFGGFPRSFYNAYHSILPKQRNFEKRQDLYKLFHYLNHWNHFGAAYRNSSISIMRKLLKEC